LKGAMKQRLVGTIVIGCLAIIFIPVLLDGEGVSPPTLNTDIPEAPPMPTVPDIKHTRPQISADTIASATENTNTDRPATSDVQEDTAETTASAEPPPAPERPRLANTGVPETWAVRLGSFGEMANAEALVTRLRTSGHKAFSRPLQASRGPLTGVYVGPVLTESDATSLKQELARAFELDGIVVQFDIDELTQ